MSLTDPANRWWNNDRTRWIGAMACFAVATILCGWCGWITSRASSPDFSVSHSYAWMPAVFYSVATLLVIGGIFLWIFADDSDGFNPRTILHPMAAMFMAQGLGDIAYSWTHGDRISALAISFTVAGVVMIIATEYVTRVIGTNRDLERQVELSGVSTTGYVTRTRGFSIDYSPVARVTVKFADQTGATRWVSKTVAGRPEIGSSVRVKYLPSKLGRKSAVVITL